MVSFTNSSHFLTKKGKYLLAQRGALCRVDDYFLEGHREMQRVAVGVDREDQPRCDREWQCRVSIYVGYPTQRRLLVLELQALVGWEVEQDVVLSARAARIWFVVPASSILKAHHVTIGRLTKVKEGLGISVCWQRGWQSRVTAKANSGVPMSEAPG